MNLRVMAELNVNQIEAVVNEFFAPATSNVRKREIECYLAQYSQDAAFSRTLLGYLASSTNPYVSMFCLTSLERIIHQSWTSLEPRDRMEFRLEVQSLLERVHAKSEPFVRKKLVKILVDIARFSWPHEYPEFIPQICQLLEVTPVLGLTFVLTASEELGNPRGIMTAARKAELRKLLHADFPRIVGTLMSMLRAILERRKRPVTPPPSPVNNASTAGSVPSARISLGEENRHRFGDDEKEILSLALVCIGNVFSWAPLTMASSCGDPLFVVDAVFCCASADTDGDVGEAALGVLIELIGKNLVPVECHDFLAAVLKYSHRLLKLVVMNGGEKLANVGLGFNERLTEYLRLLISSHVRRLETLKAADKASLDEFLHLIVLYSFNQPSIERFIPTLEIWVIFLDYLKAEDEAVGRRTETAGTPSVGRHSDVVVSLAERLLHKIQFRHNQVELEELDDDKPDEDGETEWQKFLRHCIEMLAKIAELAPDFAVSVVLQPLDDALKVYLQLESTVTQDAGSRRLSCTAENECRKLHCLLRDLATFLQAAGRFGEFFVDVEFRSRFNGGLAVFSKLCETATVGSRAKFYTMLLALPALRDDFVEAMAQSLAALKPWCHWFAQTRSELVRKEEERGLSSPIPFSKRQWDEFLRFMLRTVVLCVEPDAPEKISIAGSQLLCTLTKVVRPPNILEMEEIRSFVERVPQMHLPKDGLLLLYRSIANAVILTWPGAGVGSGDSARQDQLNSFTRSLTSELLSVGRVGLQGPQAFAVIEKALVILTDLVENVEDETTATRTMLCRSIQPHLAVCSTLLGPCVLESSTAAEAILAFFYKAFQVLRTPLGVEAAGKIVETVLAAFAAAGVMESCFSNAQQTNEHRQVELLLAILALDSGGRPGASHAFVVPTLELCLDRIHPHIKTCPELASPLFEVLAKTLSNNWRFFFEKAIGGGGGDLIPGKEELFKRLMEAIGATFLEPDLHVFRQNLAALEELNTRWRLFSKPVFKGTLLYNFERVLMDALLKGTYDLLQDEIVACVYGMAETDFGDFYLTFLPAYVDTIAGLKPELKASVIQTFSHQTDSLSFKQNLSNFVNDVRFHTVASP